MIFIGNPTLFFNTVKIGPWVPFIRPYKPRVVVLSLGLVFPWCNKFAMFRELLCHFTRTLECHRLLLLHFCGPEKDKITYFIYFFEFSVSLLLQLHTRTLSISLSVPQKSLSFPRKVSILSNPLNQKSCSFPFSPEKPTILSYKFNTIRGADGLDCFWGRSSFSPVGFYQMLP